MGPFAAVFALPFVKRGCIDAMLAANLDSRHSCFLLCEDANDLFLTESLFYSKVSCAWENSRATLAYF